jgi:hypothetical protein
LQEQLSEAVAGKAKAEESLRVLQGELAELKAKCSQQKRTRVDRGEFEFSINSLK